jgi:hypothetical protein
MAFVGITYTAVQEEMDIYPKANTNVRPEFFLRAGFQTHFTGP